MDEWKPLPGGEGYYEISRTGRVRRLPWTDSRGVLQGAMEMKVTASGPPNCRYHKVCIQVARKKKLFLVHRLLALAFIPNPEGKPHINHKDGDKLNNALDNLEWCTHKENIRHAIKTGLMPLPKTGKGQMSPSSKLCDWQVREIKRRLAVGESAEAICTDYGVVAGTIGHIKAGATWSHIS